jgi:hypothetical protein
MTENIPETTQPEENQQPQTQRQVRRGGREWILGIILILLAGMMLLRNANITTLHNWWALFILLPALGALSDAWAHARQAGGRFNRRARGALVLGLVLLAVTAVFLLDLKWTLIGPGLLALAGLGLVLNALFPD